MYILRIPAPQEKASDQSFFLDPYQTQKVYHVTFYAQYASPIGQMRMLSDGIALTALQPAENLPTEPTWVQKPDLPLFSRVRAWLDAYFRGTPACPSSLPLSPGGTAFQSQVWDLLRSIPWGETLTYKDIAREISETMSPQAVGGAVGRNPIAIIIPCHRVLGTRGALTGYAWGLERKIRLLNHEGHHF